MKAGMKLGMKARIARNAEKDLLLRKRGRLPRGVICRDIGRLSLVEPNYSANSQDKR
jgi:hypothetical protein